jgi:hypothetical protein
LKEFEGWFCQRWGLTGAEAEQIVIGTTVIPHTLVGPVPDAAVPDYPRFVLSVWLSLLTFAGVSQVMLCAGCAEVQSGANRFVPSQPGTRRHAPHCVDDVSVHRHFSSDGAATGRFPTV